MSATGPISGRRRTKAPVYYGSDSGSSESEEESDSDHHQIINENSDYEEEEEDAGPQIQQILGVKEDENQESETYYVKWSNLSYIHCTWLSLDEILSTPGGDVALRKFKKKTNDDELSRSNSIPSLLTASQDDLNLNWFHVERIIGKKDGKFFVKWKSLPYDQCTWEDPEDIPDKTVIDAYVKRSMHHNPTTIDKSIRSKELAKNKNASKRSDFNENKNSGDNSDEKDNSNAFEPLTEPLKDKSGNTLRPYQLEGLNWLRYCWHNHINSILADEMGLGKTVQIVSVLNDIATNAHITGPFLIIAPLTTLPQWKNEFERWTILNAIIYHGSPTTREIIEEYEFPAYDENGQEIPNAVSFDALITNYETFVTNFQKLKEIEWRYLVLDEGHRLKNHSGKCYQLLLQLTYEHCTLLTGTPIQNNVEELWSLLHLLHPSVFNDLPEFLERFGNIDNVETLRSLQELIRPFLLRRKKNDVETSIAAKEETIIEVELTRIQKTYYRAFLHESASTLLQQITGGSLPSLLNLMMQLRKVCNHPFLIKGAREDIEEQIKQKMPEETDIEDIELKALIDASGKMILIDKLLPKLQNDGHKVLIFSQMVKVLDIIEDYLIRKDLTFERIDGSVPESERESAIERFGKQPDIFIFLLCTKAGGVGINLTAADTVIIFDSDWNPQNDVQAQSRCHRIGQKREVKVYRLVTRGTYELQMLDRASKKLGLDHALLDGGELNHSQPMAAKEIEKLLRHGAYDITHDDDTEIDNFCSADIDQILERRSKKLTSEDSSTSLFNKAKFDPEKDSLDLNASDFWAHVLPSVSFAKDEPLARRRCRRDTPNVIDHDSSSDSETPIPEKTNRKKISPVSIRGTIRRLLNFGLGDCQYQRAILHQAAFMSNLSPVEEQYIKNLLNIDDIQNPPEEIVNALAEFSSNLNDVRERKTSIVRRCILFYRLKPLIKKLQGQVNIWPPSDSIDPMLDYALLLGISENGIGEGSNTFEGLSNEEPRLISLKSLEKKLFGLIDALEQELGPLNPEEEDVEIKGPQEWKEAHPNLYNRAYLNNEELQSLFQTIANFGLPRKSFDLSLEFYYPYESNGILDDFTYHHNGKRNINSTSNISNNVSNSVSNNVSDNVSDNEKDKHNEEQSNEQNYNEENNNKENCDDKNNEQNFNEENHNEENHNEEKNNEEKNNEEKNNEEKNNEENNNEENNNEENHNEENHNKQNHNEENNNDQNHNEENNNEENNHEQNNNEENNYNINNNNKIDIHENNEENNCQINDHNVNYNINDNKEFPGTAKIDWECVMKYAKLTCVSLEAITKAGEEIAAFAAEDENIEIHNPVVARLGSYGSKQWQRKLRNAIRDIDRVRAFVPTLSEMDDQLMKKVKQFDAIDWWEPKHDRALLYAIAEYGQLLVTTWVADSERPFREHIAPDLLEDFDKAVEIEKQKGRQCKPKDPGDLAFIFKDKLRITRALLVVRYVESHREKVKERRSNANSSCGHKLPMPLSRSLVLVSLGRFNTKDSRYPIGYIVRRMYYHATNPSKQVWYEASVNDFNKFTVKLLAEPYYGYSGSTPDAVWGCINNSIERTYEQLNNPSTIPPTLMNGSYLYGFNDMYIIDSIRKQKNTYVPVPQIMSQPQQMGYQSQSVIQQAQILQPIPSPSHPSAPVNNIPPQVLSPQPNQYQSYPPQPQQVMSKTQPYPMLQPQHMMYKSYQGSYQVAYKPVPIIGSNAYQQIPVQPSPIQMPPNAKMEMTTEPLMMPQQPMMQMPYQKQPQHLQHRPHVQIQNMHSNIPSNMSNVLSTQNIPHPQMNPIHYPQIMQHQAQKIPQKNNQKIQNYIENPNHVANNNNSNSSNHDQSLTSPVKKRIQIQPLSNASSTNDPNLESSSNLNADMEKYSTVKKNVVTSAVVKKRVVQAQNLHQTENDTKSGTSAQTNSGQMKFDMLLTSGNSVSSAKVVKTHKAAVKNHNFRNTNDH